MGLADRTVLSDDRVNNHSPLNVRVLRFPPILGDFLMEKLRGLNIAAHPNPFFRRVGRRFRRLRCTLFLRETWRVGRKIADVTKSAINISKVLPDHFRGGVLKAGVVQWHRTLSLQQQRVLFCSREAVARTFKSVRYDKRLLFLQQTSQCCRDGRPDSLSRRRRCRGIRWTSLIAENRLEPAVRIR